MTSDVTNNGVQIQVERKRLKRELTLLPLFGLIYFTVCGGSFGIEPLVGWSGPGLAMLLVVITPLVFSLPNLLMVRELQSMMPVEGGYYHWVKQGFGPFAGYMAGWMNWVVSWVDVSIYPILAAYYLGYFIPALRDGATIGGMDRLGGAALLSGRRRAHLAHLRCCRSAAPSWPASRRAGSASSC